VHFYPDFLRAAPGFA